MRQLINSKFDLVQYCLRKLGAPVIRINITEQQIDDRINDAIDMFLQFHMDGSYRGVYLHRLTKEDQDSGKIILPDTIMSVVGVYKTSDPSLIGLNNSNQGNLQVQAYFSDLIGKTYYSNDISSYTVSQSYMSMMNNSLGGNGRVTSYHIYENKLSVPDINLNKLPIGTIFGIDSFQYKDADEVGKVYNDYWVKQYSTALLKLQWANNINKFVTINLPGGGVLNGESLLQQALQEIAELEQKLKDQYSYPIEAFMN